MGDGHFIILGDGRFDFLILGDVEMTLCRRREMGKFQNIRFLETGDDWFLILGDVEMGTPPYPPTIISQNLITFHCRFRGQSVLFTVTTLTRLSNDVRYVASIRDTSRVRCE